MPSPTIGSSLMTSAPRRPAAARRTGPAYQCPRSRIRTPREAVLRGGPGRDGRRQADCPDLGQDFVVVLSRQRRRLLDLAGVTLNSRAGPTCWSRPRTGSSTSHHGPVVHGLRLVEDLARAQNWDGSYVSLEQELEPDGSRGLVRKISGTSLKMMAASSRDSCAMTSDTVRGGMRSSIPEDCHEPVEGPAPERADTQPFVVCTEERACDKAGRAKRSDAAALDRRGSIAIPQGLRHVGKDTINERSLDVAAPSVRPPGDRGPPARR